MDIKLDWKIVFTAGFILALIIFTLGGRITEWELFGAKVEMPVSTPATVVLPTLTSMPSATNAPLLASNCSFIETLVMSGDVLQSHRNSNGYYGVWIHLDRPVEVPAGWLVGQGDNRKTGPTLLSAGVVTDIEAPESCRPLPGPWGKVNCSFLDVLVNNGTVQEWLYYPLGILGGAKVQLNSSIDVPEGWTVQRGLGDEYGAISLPAETTASFWSPIDCRPLQMP